MRQIYNDRRLFYGAAAGYVPSDNFAPVLTSGANADRRGSRSRGMWLCFQAFVVFPLAVDFQRNYWKDIYLFRSLYN